MTGLLLLLAAICGFFAASLEKEELLIKEKKPRYVMNLPWILAAIPAYMVYSHYWYAMPVLIFAGVFFLIISFVYLEVIRNKRSLHHAGLNIMMLVILAAVNRIPWNFVLYLVLLYLSVYLIMIFIYKRKAASDRATKHFMQILELSRILNGMLVMIIGLVLATNSIRFLEKMARILF